MDLDFSEEQEMLREMVRGMCAEYSSVDTVRELEEIRIHARRPEAGRALVEALSGELRARVVFAESVAEAVKDAGVVCTATSAREPLLLGEMLEQGAHVNAVGSFRPEMQ